MSGGGTYDLPFGRGRQYLTGSHPAVNAILGGWFTSWLFLWNSGKPLRWGQVIWDGKDPNLDDRTRDRWFDTSRFQRSEPFTPRTNPWQFPGLNGPKYWNRDGSISKLFPVREGMQLELKLEAYNFTNSFVPDDPIVNVLSPAFGRSTGQMLNNRGREVQYSLKLHL